MPNMEQEKTPYEKTKEEDLRYLQEVLPRTPKRELSLIAIFTRAILRQKA